jgi:hypothetical protein
VPADQTSMASGLIATTRAVGQALSVAIAGATFIGFGGAAAGAALSLGAPTAAAVAALDGTFLDALRAALLISGVFAATGAVLSLSRSQQRPVQASQRELVAS